MPCEILVCVKNLGNSGSLNIDSHAPKRGDIIDVHPAGWGWGLCELGQVVQVLDGDTGQMKPHPNGNHPMARILKLTNVSVAQASNMLTREQDIDPQNPSPYLQFRARFLDFTKIPAATMQALIDYWNDDGRAQGFITLNYSASQINSITTATDDVGCPAYHARIAFP